MASHRFRHGANKVGRKAASHPTDPVQSMSAHVRTFGRWYQYRPGGDARRFLEGCGLDEAAKAAFAHGNWLRLIGGAAA